MIIILGLVILVAALVGQRYTARACTASQLGNGAGPPDVPLRPAGNRWSRLRHLSHRLAPAQTAAQSDALADNASAPGPA